MIYFFSPALELPFATKTKDKLSGICFLIDIFLNIETVFLSLLMTPGEQLDILLAASKIRQPSIISMMFHIFVALPTFAKSIRRTYILMYQSRFEVSELELS